MNAGSKLYVHYKEEEMLPYAFCYLHELYPKRNGWDLNFLRDDQLSFPDFVIERVSECMVTRIVVMVRMHKRITEYHISEMLKYEKIIRVESNYKIEKVLIVPTGCDVSNVPENFKIIFLKEFHL
jgi:hypothetical protein